jgi:hypothetical protein
MAMKLTISLEEEKYQLLLEDPVTQRSSVTFPHACFMRLQYGQAKKYTFMHKIGEHLSKL